jgi:hypothetical protein
VQFARIDTSTLEKVQRAGVYLARWAAAGTVGDYREPFKTPLPGVDCCFCEYAPGGIAGAQKEQAIDRLWAPCLGPVGIPTVTRQGVVHVKPVQALVPENVPSGFKYFRLVKSARKEMQLSRKSLRCVGQRRPAPVAECPGNPGG